MFSLNLFIIALSISTVFGRKGFGPTDQEWGYVTVRQGAHMFWWLHYTMANVDDPATRPLIIWIQGGPGASGTGYGNFGEIGPMDENFNIRTNAWTNEYNVLFVDNPVGSGFSYVDSSEYLTTDNAQITADFLVLLQNFFTQFPKLSQTPLYIFSESYGGKMTADIGLALYKAQKQGQINSNLKGVGLGDSWISPVDSCLTWGPYLLSQGLVDEIGYQRIQRMAEKTANAVSEGKLELASYLWDELENVVTQYSNTDFYNILTKEKVTDQGEGLVSKNLKEINDTRIYMIMNIGVRPALQLQRTWISQSTPVFDALRGDFMRPVINVVEKLLDETDISVVVYNGQLDLIVDTPGTIKWVNNMKWNGADQWRNTDHSPMVVDEIIEGFYKTVGRLSFYWVSRAGHMVPYDNPSGMNFILKQTTGV